MRAPRAISIIELMELVPNEDVAVAFFEEKRWKNQLYCPRCGSLDASPVRSRKPMPYWCGDCRSYFSVRTGTVMEGSNLPLRKWLLAIYLMHTSRKGVSSTQMARLIGVTQKTAWFLGHRIREAMAYRGGLMFETVEVDETYIGGREGNKHSNKRLREYHPIGKIAVMGFFERHSGRVRAFPIGWDHTSENYQKLVRENVARKSTVYTDEHSSYVGLAGDYRHMSISHSRGEYVWGDVHTNSIEGFWAQVKRAYMGTFHWMSFKHVHRYINEVAYRQSLGHDNGPVAIARLLGRMHGMRLTYRELISSPDPLPQGVLAMTEEM